MNEMTPLIPASAPLLDQSGTTDPTAVLTAALSRMQGMQNQPLVPNSPGAQLGAILQGWGTPPGQQNPSLQFWAGQRHQDMQGMQAQAGIAAQVGSLANQRAGRDLQERQLKLEQQKAEDTRQKTIMEMAKGLEDSASYDERLLAFRMKQLVKNPITGEPLLPTDAPIEKMAYQRGKDYQNKYNQALEILKNGGDPFDPATFGDQFPKEYFPADAWMKTLTEKGPGALEFLKLGDPKQPTEGALKARAIYLKTIPEDKRTEAQTRELQAIGEVYPGAPGTQVDRLAKTMREERLKKGLPDLEPSTYIILANAELQNKDSFNQDLDKKWRELVAAGQFKPEQEFDWKFQKRKELAGAQAEAAFMGRGLEANDRDAVVALRNLQRLSQRLRTEFTPQERAKYVGYFQYPANQLAQYVRNDPKFATFSKLVSQDMANAFAEGGKQLTPFEAKVVFGFVPTGRELSLADFDAKLNELDARAEFLVGQRVSLATTAKKYLGKDLPVPTPAPMPPSTPKGQRFHYKRLPNGDVQVEVVP